MMTTLPVELEDLIERLCPSDSPWDKAGEFDGFEILNARFPNVESLREVGAFRKELEAEMERTNAEIVKTLRLHTRSVSETKSDVDSVRSTVKELEQLIGGVQTRASETERAVREVSEEIMNLERAKRNVNLTVQTLKRVVMMVNSCEELVSLGGRREYDKTASLVLVVNDLTKELDELRSSSSRVDELIKHGERVFGDLKIQVTEDFVSSLDFGVAATGPNDGGAKRVHMVGAGETIEALGIKEEVLKKYMEIFFKDYRGNFGVAEKGQFAPLDYAERRFQWLSKALREFTDTRASSFPESWLMSAALCWEFCVSTRLHFNEALSTLGSQGSNQGSLLTVMSKCVELENDMQRRFEKMYKGKSGCPTYKGVMSGAFEGYVGVWITAEERVLMEFVLAMRAVGVQGDEVMDNGKMVYSSAVELFTRLKGSFNKLKPVILYSSGSSSGGSSGGGHISEIYKVYKRVILVYIDQVLRGRLPSAKIASEQHIEAIATVIGSSEYCISTAQTLSKVMVEALPGGPEGSVIFKEELSYIEVLQNEAIDTAVASILGAEVKEGYKEMVRLDWWSIEEVAEVSKCIPRIISYISRCLRSIHNNITGNDFVKIVHIFASRFVLVTNETINLLRPISEIGAQQLLVDFGALKTALVDLPQTAIGVKDQKYSQTMSGGFGKLENLLKALASPASAEVGSLREMIISLDPNIKEEEVASEIERVQWLRTQDAKNINHTVSGIRAAFTTPAKGSALPTMGQVEQLFAAAQPTQPPPPPPVLSKETAASVSQALKKGLNKFFANR